MAWRHAGRTLDELAFKSQATVYGSWAGLILNILILVAQFWTGIAPIGYADMTAAERVDTFFQLYLAAPIVIVMYFAYKFVRRTKIKKIREIDITSGMRETNLAEILAEERRVQATWPWWKKVWKTLC